MFFALGQRATDPHKIQCAVGSLDNPLEEPTGCLSRRAETHGRAPSSAAGASEK